MKVFLTSGTGYVGAAIAQRLLAQDHHVAALARSDERAKELQGRGIEPVRGDLQSLDVLKLAASQADAVIHTAFIHTGNMSFDDRIAVDRAATAALIDGLAGTNKALITTSGGGVLGDTGPLPMPEDLPVDPTAMPFAMRALSERDTMLAVNRGVRSCVVRLPPYVYGHGGPGFALWQLQGFAAAGACYYFGSPDHMISAVHVDDVAEAYLLALEKAPPASIFNVANDHGLRADAIAEAMAANLGHSAPVSGLTMEEAATKNVVPVWIVPALLRNIQMDSGKAERVLGWRPAPRPGGMLEDIRSGSYKK